VAASTFPLGSRTVHRMGFGAMQLPGPGVFGPPVDRDEAIAVLRAAVDAGVDHIDTAQYYGPDVANELIRAALHPYPEGLALVSKVGARRDEKGAWLPANSPAELRAGVEANLRSLGVDTLAAVNLRLHEPGPVTPELDERLDAMAAMRDEGLIGGVGVSNVSLEQFEHVLARTEIACVQNPLNVVDRASWPVLEACRERSIAFVPFFPLGSAFGGQNRVLTDPVVTAVAARLGATASQVALAWLLASAPNVLLIPGTRSLVHLAENLATGSISLDDDALADFGAPAGPV